MTGSENINELFADNAFYLLAHHRRILADSRMSLCSLPSVGGLAYLGSIEGITLGCWLEWWLNCSFSRFYSREEETAPEGASTGEHGVMLKSLVYSVSGSPLSGSNSCGAVREDGSRISCSFSPFLRLWTPLLKRGRDHLPGSPTPGTAILGLNQVIDQLKEEDRQQYRDEEEAGENFCRIVDEVFAGTDQWVTECNFFRSDHNGRKFRVSQNSPVISLEKLSEIKNRLAELVQSAPKQLRRSEEFCTLIGRLEAEKDPGIHGLTNSTAASAESSLLYYASEYLKLVTEMKAGIILKLFAEYSGSLAGNENELSKISEEISAARRGLREGTVTQKEARMGELKKRKEELMGNALSTLAHSLIKLLGEDCYRALNFQDIAVLERFVTEHKRAGCDG